MPQWLLLLAVQLLLPGAAPGSSPLEALAAVDHQGRRGEPAGIMSYMYGTGSHRLNATADCPGVVNDGVTPVAASLQLCLAQLCVSCGEVWLSPGSYFLESTVEFPTAPPEVGIAVRGAGRSTKLLWMAHGDMFVWAGPANGITISGLSVLSGSHQTGSGEAAGLLANRTAFRFLTTFTQSLIEAVFISATRVGLRQPQRVWLSEGDEPPPISGFDLSPLTDSVTIRDCQLWQISGVGVKVGRGSEVRIAGGRNIGTYGANNPHSISIGVHCTGGNGGVMITDTGIIAHHEGLRLDDSAKGAGSNREIFLAHATLDSSWRNLAVWDNSYIDITGVWAASAQSDNIFISNMSAGSLVSIVGGTIFSSCPPPVVNVTKERPCNGLVVLAGSFTMAAVNVRFNQGIGVLVGPAVSDFTISGCKVTERPS